MSKEINNREVRKQAIKDMLKMLHEGKNLEEVKDYFAEVFKSVSASEISAAEQALIDEGLPVSEVQKLCDIHSAVFKGSIEEIHSVPESEKIGHPVWIIKTENQKISDIVNEELLSLLTKQNYDQNKILKLLSALENIKIHYQRKENILFPYLEKYGISGPPKVMWGVDDEIRAKLKAAKESVAKNPNYSKETVNTVKTAADGINEMVFKEDNILIPMLLETLTEEEWGKIALQIPEIGYCFIEKPPVWTPPKKTEQLKLSLEKPASLSSITLPTGVLGYKELEGMLNTLPIDISFVDKNGVVKYFSENAERIFPRTKAIIGRKVVNCHPPASMHIVQTILDDFKSGKKDEESFWIKMKGQYIYIRYFAVRKDGEFLGTLEVTQEISKIQSINGEKRLMSE